MKQYFNIAYILPILVIIIFIIGSLGCHNFGQLDIRTEFNEGEEKNRPDYFG